MGLYFKPQELEEFDSYTLGHTLQEKFDIVHIIRCDFFHRHRQIRMKVEPVKGHKLRGLPGAEVAFTRFQNDHLILSHLICGIFFRNIQSPLQYKDQFIGTNPSVRMDPLIPRAELPYDLI